ncbi:MAG: SDR family NAD(P)-dependent oxidoreductase [Opitutaceae bacterium]
MDIAIVTGAETPLGLRIIQGLIQQGCRVHGIGNNLSKVTYADRNFIAHAIDVSDLSAIQTVASEILEKEGALHILVHAIDVTPGAAFEKLPVGNLEAILKIGLLGPVILTRLALPNLLRFRGQLINVIPANKSGHAASAVNALIEGGLRGMNTALFDQARDSGVKVTNLILKQNPELPCGTVSDDQLDQTRIDLDQVARTIDYLLNASEFNVPNEITLHPRLSAGSEAALPESPLPVDPYDAIVLPPAEYCPPEEPKITTKQPERIDRTIPYTDEEMEEKIAAAIEDFEVHPERYEPKPKTQRPNKKKRENKESGKQQSESKQSDKQQSESKQSDHQQRENRTQTEDGESNNSKRRRGRRRGGRNRNRNRDDKDTQTQQNDKTESQFIESKSMIVDESGQLLTKKPSNRRRRGARKPDSAKEDKAALPTTEMTKEKNQTAPENAKTNPTPRPEVEKTEDPKLTSKKVAKKRTAKKAAKKVSTKKATKKTVVKKAAKKSPAKKAAKKKVAKKVVKKAAKKKAAKKAE